MSSSARGRRRGDPDRPRTACQRIPPAARDLAADVVFRPVGVERNFRPVEYGRQLGLVGVQPAEQPIEGDKAGPGGEQSIRTPAQRRLAAWRWLPAIRLKIGVEPPETASDPLNGPALIIGEGVELID